MVELKPCPFCGHAPLLTEIPPHKHHLQIGDFRMPDHPGSFTIECGCGCGLIDETQAAVVKRWNTRAAAAMEGSKG